ncbi:MAG: flagellar FlbD family protein [Synergistales bacterium]|nr:flagellar FlbD family protein [Synergistales bacterium]
MIEVTRFDGSTFYLNVDLVETVEATPDTVILLSNGHRYVVREQMRVVVDRIRTAKDARFRGAFDGS